VIDTTAQNWIDDKPNPDPAIDGQFCSSSTVCIDPDATGMDIPGREDERETTLLL